MIVIMICEAFGFNCRWCCIHFVVMELSGQHSYETEVICSLLKSQPLHNPLLSFWPFWWDCTYFDWYYCGLTFHMNFLSVAMLQFCFLMPLIFYVCCTTWGKPRDLILGTILTYEDKIIEYGTNIILCSSWK